MAGNLLSPGPALIETVGPPFFTPDNVDNRVRLKPEIFFGRVEVIA